MLWALAPRARGVLAPESPGSADSALWRRLEELCPKPLLEAEAEEALEVTLDVDSDPQGEWLLADLQKPASKQAEEPDRRVAERCAAAAAGVELELRWYFQERDSRFLGWRRDPVGRPCARTIFARRLRRFAATSLRSNDRALLDAWCTYLRRVAEARPFSSSNLMWKSQFERSLIACLVRLEALSRWIDSEADACLPACAGRKEDVHEAVVRRERATLPRVPLKHFALYRQITRVQVPGFWGLLRLQSLTAGLALSAAHLALAEQLLMVARDYYAGELDESTLAEDALVSLSSAGIFVLACSASPALALGAGWATLPLEALGPSFLAWLTGIVVRTSGRRLCGGPALRSLRCAYVTLGLNAGGVAAYTTRDVEAQLEWALRQRRADTQKLWAAYEYIRQHQHGHLRDPWEKP